MPEPEPVEQISYLYWAYSSLGVFYFSLLALAAVVSLALVTVLVLRGKGPMAAAALVLVVPLPLVVGLIAALHGGISSYIVIATSPTAPRPSDVAMGISMALIATLVSTMSMLPGLFLAIAGSLIRSLRRDETVEAGS